MNKQLKSRFLTCESCHESKRDAKSCIDPYSLDINNEEVKVVLCDLCYIDRVEDI